jgi:hypothetical protein
MCVWRPQVLLDTAASNGEIINAEAEMTRWDRDCFMINHCVCWHSIVSKLELSLLSLLVAHHNYMCMILEMCTTVELSTVVLRGCPLPYTVAVYPKWS